MNEKVLLSKPIDIGNDLSTKSFRLNYAYFQGNFLTVYLDPVAIGSLRIVFQGQGIEPDDNTIVLPDAAADKIRKAVKAIQDACAERLENPFVAVQQVTNQIT